MIPVFTDVHENSGLFLETDSSADIDQAVYDCLDQYTEWREACLKAAASASSAAEVLDLCASLLSNPIALFDESLVLNAYSGKIPESVEGTIWEEVIAKGMSRPEIYSGEESDMIARELKSGKKSFVWNSALFHGQEHICANVYRKGIPCGILGASDLYKGFSAGEICLVEDCSDFISLYFSTHSDPAGRTNLYYIERMLNGLSINPLALKKSIEPRSWQIHDTYQVFSLRRGTANDYANTSYQKRLQALFPQDTVMIHEDHLVLLTNLTKNNLPYGEALQKQFGFAAGASLPFSCLGDLYASYVQSLIALSYAEENSTVVFGDVYSRYIIEALAKVTEIRALCHPGILALCDKNDETAFTLIHILRVYLECGRNIAMTARRLYIHRNTLLYRLEKLDEFLDVRLNEIDHDEAFMYLLTCMILESERPGRR